MRKTRKTKKRREDEVCLKVAERGNLIEPLTCTATCLPVAMWHGCCCAASEFSVVQVWDMLACQEDAWMLMCSSWKKIGCRRVLEHFKQPEMVYPEDLNGNGSQNGNDTQGKQGSESINKTDTTSFANIMAAVNRMRSEAAGNAVVLSSPRSSDQRVGYVSEETNKRQKLPERVKPPLSLPPSTTNRENTRSGDALPPRVDRPTLPAGTLASRSNYANHHTTPITMPARVTPAGVAERYQRPAPTGPRTADIHTFNQIQVSRSQAGNPLLEYLTFYQTNSKIKDVDYVINSKCVALFLSLRYHKLHPEYIYNKLKKISYNHEDTLRVLLVYVDIEDFQDTVRELDKLCLFNKLTLILAWTNEQCANYLQNLKYVEKEASKRIIQGSRTKDEDVLANDGKYLERVVNTVSSVKSVSQSDAKSLLVAFGSVRGIVEADADQLSGIQGLGQLKVDRLLRAFNGSFTERWN